MDSFAQVLIHQSQFPSEVQKDLLESLRTRQIQYKFHFDSIKQSRKWLALHEAYSPARTDPDCAKIYDQAFESAVRQLDHALINVIGLFAGGGQKDARLLKLLSDAGKDVAYCPVEGSAAMALTAREEILTTCAPEKCFPLVCDLNHTPLSEIPDLPDRESATRIFTFFGTLHNFEPGAILREFERALRPADLLLVSANLAPGPDYNAGVRKIMPLYDNAETRDWLMTFLLDLGVESEDGALQFSIQNDPASSGLKRVEANFEFGSARRLRVGSEEFQFVPGERIRLFFSYRYTPELLRRILAAHQLRIAEQWINASGEEGVFRVTR